MASNRERQSSNPGTGGGRPGKKRLALLFIGLAVIVLLAAFYFSPFSRGARGGMVQYVRVLMDTDVTLRFESKSARQAQAVREAVFGEMERLEGLLSRAAAGSEVDLVNRKAGLEPAGVGPEMLAVTRAALEYARLSEGAFDPTVAPLLDLWGFLEQRYRVPAAAEIEAVLPLVDYTRVEIDAGRGTIFLTDRAMSMDLGGIAKGYIVDRGLAELARHGVEHAFLNAGGDIGLLGPRPDGTPWIIGIRHPRDAMQIIRTIPVTGPAAVVTSGDYERFFERGGRRYHHILNPKSGYPAAGLAGVTVVAPTAMEADALSTALFVLGPAQGLALIEGLPAVEVVLITPELEVIVSSGLAGVIESPD